MRILVYGAGVLGCYLAHSLQRKGNDVTLLARGAWKEQIDNYGLFISHFGRKHPTVDVIKTIEKLEPKDYYHVIFVTMQFTQLPEIVDSLAANESHMIVFLGNNPIPERIADELKCKSVNRKQLVFGFESVAGQRIDNKVETLHLGKGSLRVGVIDEGHSCWEERLKSVLKGTGVSLIVYEDMASWLRYHGALILPFAYACYCYDGDLKAAYRDQNLMEEMKLSIQEGYHALENLGFHMEEKDRKFIEDTGWKTDIYYRMLLCTPIGKLALANHAMNGKTEIISMADEMEKLFLQSEMPMAHYYRLKRRALNKKNENKEENGEQNERD